MEGANAMKPRDSLIKAKEFQAEELRRQLDQLERMIRDLRSIRDELGRQIEAEEARSGVRDQSHYAYSTVARAARDRREKLESSLAELEERHVLAETRLAETLEFFTAMAGGREPVVEDGPAAPDAAPPSTSHERAA
jgi:septal ring factor EnvC (AmiA/AmiB activator)